MTAFARAFRPLGVLRWPVATEGRQPPRLRRLFLGLGLLAVVLVALLAAAPLLLSGEFVRERVVAHLAETTGATVRVSRSHVALYPRPRVVMENVRLGATHLGGAEARIDRLEVDVALLPALGGRIVPTAMRAARPHLVLRPGARSMEALRAALPAGPLPWPRLTVSDGRIDWQSRGRTLRVTALDATLAAQGTRGRGATLDGSAVWNGEPVTFETETGDVVGLAAGEATARVALDANPLSLAFEGRLDLASGRVAGRTALETVSMERAVEWLALGRDAPALPASLTGRVSAGPRDAAFREAELRIGDARAEGSLTVERRLGRFAIAGTLALDEMNVAAGPLTRALAARRPDARADLQLAHLRAVDLDLRLSAPGLQLAGTRLDDVAATLRTSRRTATLAVGDAVLGGGHAQARLKLETVRATPHSGPTTRAALTLNARNVNVAAIALPGTAGPSKPKNMLRPRGRGDLSLRLAAKGRTPQAMLRSLRGRGAVTLRDGALEGFDLAVAAHATRSGALPRQARVWNGATGFRRLSATFRLSDGVAALNRLGIDGQQLVARLRGRVDLVRGAIALRGDVGLRGTDVPGVPGAPAAARGASAFFVGGTLQTPLLVPVDAIEPPPEAHRSG